MNSQQGIKTYGDFMLNLKGCVIYKVTKYKIWHFQ